MFLVKFTQIKMDLTIFEKQGERGNIFMVAYIKISLKLGLQNLYKVCLGA